MMKERSGLARLGVPVDLINGRVYGCNGLQRISVDQLGKVQKIVSMDVVEQPLTGISKRTRPRQFTGLGYVGRLDFKGRS